MIQEQPNNPLHGITLERIVNELKDFSNNPTIKSSLKFLRKTDWARIKVEKLYLRMQQEIKGE